MSTRKELPDWLANLFAMHSIELVLMPGSTASTIIQYEVRCVKCRQNLTFYCHPDSSDWGVEEYIAAAAKLHGGHSDGCKRRSYS